MNNQPIKSYCYECDKKVFITIKDENISDEINGIKVEYTGKKAYCNECGEEVYISFISDANIEIAHNLYNERR